MNNPDRSHPKINEVIRSNRRSFGLEIKPDGRLVIRAPRHATQSQIEAIVAQKAAWIRQKQAVAAERFPNAQPKNFTPGETFWYLGQQYPLKLTDRRRPPLELEGAFLLSRTAQNRAKAVFINWYREETRSITYNLIETYSQNYDFQVGALTINSARTRWGSCSGQNNLNFTYRLSMAPFSVVDYVVVHELCHLKVRNHSAAFWQAVRSIKPNYEQEQGWLKQNGALLTLD